MRRRGARHRRNGRALGDRVRFAVCVPLSQDTYRSRTVVDAISLAALDTLVMPSTAGGEPELAADFVRPTERGMAVNQEHNNRRYGQGLRRAREANAATNETLDAIAE